MNAEAIRRWRVGDEWRYEDEDEQVAVFELALLQGFDLPAFDDWVLSEPRLAPDDEASVLEHRRRLLVAHREGNEEARYAWGMYLASLVFLNRREAFLHPLAVTGKRHKETQAARRRDKPGTSDDHDASRNRRIRAMHARLKAQGRDATAETAQQFNLTDRTIRRIVNAK